MKDLLKAYGWEEIPSKNKIMFSFKKEDLRLNYYFTNGTVTIQGGGDGGCETYKKILTEEQMEKIIS